jgi:hypothetical protein
VSVIALGMRPPDFLYTAKNSGGEPLAMDRPAGRLRPGVRKDRQHPVVETEWLCLVAQKEPRATARPDRVDALKATGPIGGARQDIAQASRKWLSDRIQP